MKNWLAIIFFLLCTISISAQTELIVELIFEDAANRTDTAFIGVSESACDTSLNTALGEEKINIDFSEDLLFRIAGTKTKEDSASGVHTYRDIFSKTFFFNNAQDYEVFQVCGSRRQMALFKCRITDFPLKISWNWLNENSEFNYYREQSKLSTDVFVFSGGSGGIVADLPSDIFLRGRDSIVLHEEDMTLWTDSPQDYLLLFSLRQLITGTKAFTRDDLEPVHVFPNPSFDNIRLNMEESCDQCTIQFYDVNGTLLQAHAWQDADIDITNLPKGMISGLVMEKGIPVASFRFLKMK